MRGGRKGSSEVQLEMCPKGGSEIFSEIATGAGGGDEITPAKPEHFEAQTTIDPQSIIPCGQGPVSSGQQSCIGSWMNEAL
jgi:hypothetical protein